MRDLAKINKVSVSTHATVGITGVAGFDGQRGFDEQQRNTSMKEIKKAIDFAAEATSGGAVVFHTGEWNRPIYDSHGKGKDVFKAYKEEDVRAPISVVDKRTGEIQGMRKDVTIYEPIFKTVTDYEKEKGIKLIGKIDPTTNEKYEANDWISIKGSVIKRDWEFDSNKAQHIFERIPKYNEKESKFETQPREWNYFLRLQRLDLAKQVVSTVEYF